MFVRKPLRLFRGIGQHTLAFVAQGKIDGSGNFFPDGGVALDLFPDRFHRRMRAQETIGQGLVFAQQSEQQVFGLNIRRAELAGLVPRKENYAPGFFRVAFEHIPIPPTSCGTPRPPPNPDPTLNYAFISPDLPSDICLAATYSVYLLALRCFKSQHTTFNSTFNRVSVLPFVTPEAIRAPLPPFCPDPTVKRDGTVVQTPGCAWRLKTSTGARGAIARPVQKPILRCARRDRR